jgi:DNA replication protein DnaC
LGNMFDEIFMKREDDRQEKVSALMTEILPKIEAYHGASEMSHYLAEIAVHNIIRNPVRRTDEMKDGLAHCGNCGVARQVYIPRYDFVFHQPCDCERGEAKNAAQKSENDLFIDGLVSEKVMDRSTMQVSLATDNLQNPNVRESVDKYLANWETVRRDNIGILMYGDVGTGKSYYAHAMSNYLRNKGILAVNTTASAIIDTFPDQYAYLKKAEFLVIDDIGTERSTSYGYEKLFSAIDTRYKAKLPTVITTNYSPLDMTNEALPTKRVFDRIGEMCSLAIAFEGNSMRKKVSEQKTELFEGLQT